MRMVMEQAAPPRATRRHRMRWSFVVAGVAIGAAVLYLVLSNTGATAEYDMTVAQLQHCAMCVGQTVRVEGVVAAHSVARDDATQTVRFRIAQGTLTLPVVYNGVVPDIFQPGIQVVVEGPYTSATSAGAAFHAATLLTKCPSTFKTTPPAQGTSGGIPSSSTSNH